MTAVKENLINKSILWLRAGSEYIQNIFRIYSDLLVSNWITTNSIHFKLAFILAIIMIWHGKIETYVKTYDFLIKVNSFDKKET